MWWRVLWEAIASVQNECELLKGVHLVQFSSASIFQNGWESFKTILKSHGIFVLACIQPLSVESKIRILSKHWF